MHELAEEMKVVVRSRPELYPKPATGVPLEALVKLCEVGESANASETVAAAECTDCEETLIATADEVIE